LPELKAPGNVEEYEQYFTFDRQKLRAITVEDCSIISLRLTQYAFYVQRSENRIKSNIKAIKSEINRVIASTAHTYPGQWEHQASQAIQNNEYAAALSKKLIDFEQKLDRFYNIASSIKLLADQYKNLKFDKIKERSMN
jgi:hypothetical protein